MHGVVKAFPKLGPLEILGETVGPHPQGACLAEGVMSSLAEVTVWLGNSIWVRYGITTVCVQYIRSTLAPLVCLVCG